MAIKSVNEDNRYGYDDNPVKSSVIEESATMVECQMGYYADNLDRLHELLDRAEKIFDPVLLPGNDRELGDDTTNMSNHSDRARALFENNEAMSSGLTRLQTIIDRFDG